MIFGCDSMDFIFWVLINPAIFEGNLLVLSVSGISL
ncbi:hypothetical protein BVRB_4g080660 [Beta vulgaris subsp. vulgaris]|nr:hypothetical protein BVRB_4g080660 [Beta vulgaris subsp. vulgaris]